MKLFYTQGSPFARIVRIALLETGLDDRAEKAEVTLRDPNSKLLPYNPVGRVPTLELDDGTVLTESVLILAYLDSQHEGRKLLPLDEEDGWKTLAAFGQAMGFLESIVTWSREIRRPEGERSPGVVALETTRANRIADRLEAAIGEGGYGGDIDAARIALGTALGFCARRHKVWNWREGRPALTEWFDEVEQRASFTATIPPEA